MKTVLHVPLERELYLKLKQQATSMGFDSAQAYIRFWAAAETNEHINPHGFSIYSDLTSPKTQALRYVELILALHPTEFMTMEQAVQHLVQQIRFLTLRKALQQL